MDNVKRIVGTEVFEELMQAHKVEFAAYSAGLDIYAQGNVREAMTLWRKQAEQGNMWARVQLVEILMQSGEEYEDEEAIYWLKKVAVENGNPSALQILGESYIDGELFDADIEAAWIYAQLLDDANDPDHWLPDVSSAMTEAQIVSATIKLHKIHQMQSINPIERLQRLCRSAQGLSQSHFSVKN